MQNKAKEKKGILKGGNLNPFLVLMTMVVICTIVSYFVVPGAFDRETVDGVSRVVAGSYHSVERTPLSFFEMFLTVPNGLAASAAMMFAVIIAFCFIGGILGWSEHIIPFVPIVISLSLTLGYDSLVGRYGHLRLRLLGILRRGPLQPLHGGYCPHCC